MGNVFKIKGTRVTVEIMKSRVDAIVNVPTPTTARKTKRFVGMASYVARWLPLLQHRLELLHFLSRKGVPFKWTDQHEDDFMTVKYYVKNSPILSCPTSDGYYSLYCDTSRKHVGSCLFQRQDGQERLIGFDSKTLAPACRNYGVTELEMYGVVVSCKTWIFYVQRNEFDCATDHKAIVDIMKSKDPPATDRICRFLLALTYFNAMYYYIKGKDMVISDFLSRTHCDGTGTPDIVPVGFDPKEVLRNILEEREKDMQLHIMTRKQAKAVGFSPGKVHGADKSVDPDLKPEHQDKSQKQEVQEEIQKRDDVLGKLRDKYANKPRRTAAQAASRKLLTRSIRQLQRKPARADEEPHVEEEIDDPVNREGQEANDPGAMRDVIPHQLDDPDHLDHDLLPDGPDDDIIGLPGIPTTRTITTRKLADLDPTSGLDIDTNSPYKAEDIEIRGRAPIKSDFEIPPSLAEQADEGKLVTRYLPQQSDVTRILKEINRKVLRQTHFPTTMRDMQAAYLASPHFRDIYIYLMQNRLPTSARRARRLEALVKNYMLLDNLLFKVDMGDRGEPQPRLCIPIAKVDMLLQHYHSSLVGGHAGVTKTYMTISERFYCPGLADHVRAYITGCHICQMFKTGKKFNRPFQKRININVPAFSRVSMDIKHMPGNRYKFILVVLCEVSHYMVASPLRTTQSAEVCQALLDGLIKFFGPPTYIICDKDPAFLSSLTEYFAQQMNIKIVTVSPTNHKSLQAEHGIKTLSNILMKHLTGLGTNWPAFLSLAMLSYNSYSSPNLDGYSPYELALGSKVRLAPSIEVTPEIPVTATFKEYYIKLKQQLAYLRGHISKFRDVKMDLLNKDREFHSFSEGDLVYVYMPRGAMLQSGSRKIACHFVGPLVIYRAVSPNQFFLMSLDGVVYPHLIEETRLKPGTIHTTAGNVSTLAKLKEVLRAGITSKELRASPLANRQAQDAIKSP